jgi:hypothetical protein
MDPKPQYTIVNVDQETGEVLDGPYPISPAEVEDTMVKGDGLPNPENVLDEEEGGDA